jgi:hypothetical protein
MTTKERKENGSCSQGTHRLEKRQNINNTIHRA